MSTPLLRACKGFSSAIRINCILGLTCFPVFSYCCLMLLSATHTHTRLSLLLLLLFVNSIELLAQDDLPVLDLNRPLRLDFSGSWEKDFGRSDKWEDELGRMMRIRQEQAALQQTGLGGGGGPAVSVGNLNLGGGRGGANIVDMARLAEYISRQTTLNIVQTREHIRIERRGETPLICALEDGPMESFSSPHGNEYCGWDQQQLVFVINLPGELEIRHRFSVSADRENLQMLTSVSSAGSAPFNLRQLFYRYDAPAESFDCVLTLSRGRVCSQVTPLP